MGSLKSRRSRREHPRVPFHGDVQWVNGFTVGHCQGRDIGRGGIALRTDDLASHGMVKLFITVPYGDKSQLCLMLGEVVWKGDGCVGLRFINESSGEGLTTYLRVHAA